LERVLAWTTFAALSGWKRALQTWTTGVAGMVAVFSLALRHRLHVTF
jgi:hypothetical protein